MQNRVPETRNLHRKRTSNIWRGSPLIIQQSTGKCIHVRKLLRLEKEPPKRILQNSIQAHTGPEIVLLSTSQSRMPHNSQGIWQSTLKDLGLVVGKINARLNAAVSVQQKNTVLLLLKAQPKSLNHISEQNSEMQKYPVANKVKFRSDIQSKLLSL